MKLNIDCLIDVLFAVEKRTGPNQYWNVGIDSGDGLTFYTPQECTIMCNNARKQA